VLEVPRDSTKRRLFAVKGTKRGDRRSQGSKPGKGRRSRVNKLEVNKRKIEVSGLKEYYSILQF